MSRYHLRVAEQLNSGTTFQTQEADTEWAAAATAAMLAERGFVVWLYEHDHDANEHREQGMLIGTRFMPTHRPPDSLGTDGHRLR